MIGLARNIRPALRPVVVNAKTLHIQRVKADQAYGVLLGDGITLASIENRWVRKRLHREGKLVRRRRPKPTVI